MDWENVIILGIINAFLSISKLILLKNVAMSIILVSEKMSQRS